jgi:hypothetical protein
MGAEEFMNWYAYEMLSDKNYSDNITKQVELDKQKLMNHEERAELMKNFFGGLSGTGQ